MFLFLSDNEIDSIYNFWPKQVFHRSKQFLPERSIFHGKECFPTNDISRLLKKQLSEKTLCLKRTYSAKVSFLPTNHIYPKIVFARKRYLRENMDSPNIIFAWEYCSASHRKLCLPKSNQSPLPPPKKNMQTTEPTAVVPRKYYSLQNIQFQDFCTNFFGGT